MAYLELSMVAYDNLIKAAGNRGGQVAKACADFGVFEDRAAAEAPPGVAKESEPAGQAPGQAEDTEDEPVAIDDEGLRDQADILAD